VAVYLRNMIMSIMYWVILVSTELDFDGLNRVWIGVVALAISGPILSRVVYMMALARLDLSKVAVISQTRPVFVILLAFGLLSQLPTFREIIGGLFLVFGCLIMAFSRQKQKKGISPLSSLQ
jgi:drug/metabolite transporter (DMT)-like permease